MTRARGMPKMHVTLLNATHEPRLTKTPKTIIKPQLGNLGSRIILNGEHAQYPNQHNTQGPI